MRYKAGDRVRVRKDLVVGNVYGGVLFDKKMCSYLGKIVEISKVYTCYYRICDNTPFVWTDDLLEPITDLTTSEAVAVSEYICATHSTCISCPAHKLMERYNSSCFDIKLEHTDEYVEAITKWVAGDAGKKETSIEQCSYLLIIDADQNLVYEEKLKVGDDYTAVFKRYCEEHEGTYYAVRELRAVVKED